MHSWLGLVTNSPPILLQLFSRSGITHFQSFFSFLICSLTFSLVGCPSAVEKQCSFATWKSILYWARVSLSCGVPEINFCTCVERISFIRCVRNLWFFWSLLVTFLCHTLIRRELRTSSASATRPNIEERCPLTLMTLLA